MTEAVVDVVEDLALVGTSGFRASFVAGEVGAPEREVRKVLGALVESGELEVRFEVLCPDNGRTVRTYSDYRDVPFDEEMSSDRCDSEEPFVVDKDNVWIAFVPSQSLLSRVNRRARGGPRKKGNAPKARWREITTRASPSGSARALRKKRRTAD